MGTMQMTIYDYVAIGVLITLMLWGAAQPESIVRRLWVSIVTDEPTSTRPDKIAAIREMGVLSGQRIERSEVGAPGEFEALADDELERALVERLRGSV